jgi:hypothetical protein
MHDWMSSSQIAEIFSDEMHSANGKVTDTFDDGSRLFTRSVLPPSMEVSPGDRLQGGVALSSTDTNIFVHPYVFRLVCTNGAIMARSTQTRQIRRDDVICDLETTIREAIVCCCDPGAFIRAAGQMRSAQEAAADMAITLSAFMSGHQSPVWSRMLGEILHRFDEGADRSAYGLMNAVTSVARDTRDPELKWRLEEFGGSVPAMLRKTAGPRGRGRAIAVERSLVEVG